MGVSSFGGLLREIVSRMAGVVMPLSHRPTDPGEQRNRGFVWSNPPFREHSLLNDYPRQYS